VTDCLDDLIDILLREVKFMLLLLLDNLSHVLVLLLLGHGLNVLNNRVNQPLCRFLVTLILPPPHLGHLLPLILLTHSPLLLLLLLLLP
jgi:hypothetical protein